LADLLVVVMSLIHHIFKIPLEEKGLLEASGELGEETLGLDEVGHKVGVITIGFLLLRVLGCIIALPWGIMFLDLGASLLMDSEGVALF
jgi:hypothetical protein